jgi:hypothetical protein
MACTRSGEARRTRLAPALVVAAVAALTLGLPRAEAADVETRQYTIHVDGKKAGDYQLTIECQADGAVAVSAQSDVRVTVLGVPVYTYTYRGREVWKGGRLQHFESSGKEKGKEFAVRADVDGAALRVRANGQERRARPDVWTSSCWQLPEARFRNNEVPLFGCDTGADIPSRLQYVGSEQIQVAGQSQTCSHYRVMKEVPHDLWYDAQERLVRDEWVSGGHRTVLNLTALRR